ncbi:Arginine--tRNA ligase [Anaplasma phagocytophilum]|nr:hypothetical protein [Anaplasma phagocytophilum]SCV66794.1 Arginine--tRNA ligase [Anaplasma phagocytophilum]
MGYDVTKKYYVNDAVSQVKTLVSPVFLRYKEALEEEITIRCRFISRGII